jgi:large subunit ribosomal protein L1
MKKGKYLSDLYKNIDNKSFNIEDAVKFFVEKKRVKFDETLEISMNLGIDPRHADQMVRGVISLPNGNGKTMKVAVFAKDKKAEEAKVAGADVVGAEDLADDMQKGNLNYDRIVATPDMMGIVGRIGKILGPKGLMPNPKLGTVTTDVKAAVEAAKSGQIQYRAEKTGIVQAGIGKISFGSDKLIDNVKSFIESIQKAKPSGAKGTFIKKISISSTMGVGININT